MNKLSDGEIEFINKCLGEGKPLPDSYRYIIPFETKKEYELTYEGKEREEDILADTMAVPLQPVKTFGNGNGGWTNKLIFGDNLQVLKALMDDPELKGKVKLIYIDPPFATKQEFKSRYGETAYQDIIAGARFLEFLRKRLVFLREFLANNGSIFVHCDWHLGHYTRILLDEIFGKNNFRNEINVKRTAKHTAMQFEKVKSLQVATDSIFVYAKSDSTVFNKPYKEASERQKAGSWHGFSDNCYRPTMRYKLFGLLPPSHRGRWIWEKTRAEKAIENYKLFEKALSKGEGSSFEEFAYNNPDMEFVRCNNGSPQYWIAARERIMSDTSWTDIQAYAHLFDFPTEKSELLIERVINMGSNPGDIILDAFAGSGTTGAVAEKLGRRWILIDCGKLAIYTMQKRLLNLWKGCGNKGEPLKPKPFTLYNAGLYDYKMVKDLPWEKYREFVLKVFQCRDEPHRIAGVELDGYLGADSVMVFNYKKHEDVILDREFMYLLNKRWALEMHFGK